MTNTAITAIMQNSLVESHVSPKSNGESGSKIVQPAPSVIVLQAARSMCAEESQMLASNDKQYNSNNSINKCSLQSQSASLKNCLTPDLSHVLFHNKVDSEDVTPKQKNKFTRPRLNQLATQRISRSRVTPNVKANAVKQSRLPSPKKDAINGCHILMNDKSSLVDNCPKTVDDLKNLCHDILLDGFRFISEQYDAVGTGATTLEELSNQLYAKLDNKLQAVDTHVMQRCQSTCKKETDELMRQVCELTKANDMLKAAQDKLDMDFDDIRKSRDELQKLLDHLHAKNSELHLQLFDKEAEMKTQSDTIVTLLSEVEELKSCAKDVQGHITETESNLVESRKTVIEQQERIDELEALMSQGKSEKLTLNQRIEELTKAMNERDQELCKSKIQLLELDKMKAALSLATSSGVEPQAIKIVKTEVELLQDQLESLKQSKKMLLSELDKKTEALHEAEVKGIQLAEHHRQLLAMRSERINCLDQEMKQREQEHNRKINEIMAQSSEKETLITQISNELASTNEQFQKLCSTIGSKQSKLNSQEHVIKLLEESNARSVIAYTKLSEKNAILRDELKQLHRTVRVYIKILIGNKGQNIFEPVPAHEVLRLRSKRRIEQLQQQQQ